MRHPKTFHVLAAVIAVAAASCGDGDDSASPLTSEDSTELTDPPSIVADTVAVASSTAPAATFESTTFAVPFDVTVPDWLPLGTQPTATRPNFLTWESSDPERAVRFFVPSMVIQPPNATEIDVPDDYAAYLFTLTDFGATFDDIVETTVDGMPATIVTAQSANTIDGSLGCEPAPSRECWGLIPDAILRMAVIDTGDRTLLVWQRDPKDASAGSIDYESFDAMLAGLLLREDIAPTTEPALDTTLQAASTDSYDAERIPDGLYTHIATRADGEALGMGAEMLDEVFGPDGEIAVSFEIIGDRWRQLAINDAGITEVGDRGTASYDEDGRWVTVSESVGCRGCVIIVEWTYHDGTLTFTAPEGAPTNGDPVARLITEGTFLRQ